jgi:hypothetical protein
MKYLIQFLKGKKKILFLIFLTALLKSFGTSTIAGLMLCLYDIQEGQILLEV